VFLGAGDFVWFVPIAIITGLGIGADYGLPPSVLADIINSDEGKDTTRRYRRLFRPVGAVDQAGDGHRRGRVAARGGPAGVQSFGMGLYSSTALDRGLHRRAGRSIKIIAALLIWYIRIEADRVVPCATNCWGGPSPRRLPSRDQARKPSFWGWRSP
jgi:GPH family glycoside/pentoside/hexuronide:cation symporter